MGFWFYMLFLSILLPITMLLIGMTFRKKCPRNINMVLGYRTRRSMKNKHTWEFAHAYCGRIWMWGGGVILPISLTSMLCVLGRDIDTVGYVGAALFVLPILTMIVSVFATEKALKRNFDSVGRPIRNRESS